MRYSDLIENVNRRNLLKGAGALVAASAIPITPKLVDIATNIDSTNIKALKSMLKIATPNQLISICEEITDGGGISFFTDVEYNRLKTYFKISDDNDLHDRVYDIIDNDSNDIEGVGDLYKSIFNEDPTFVKVFNIAEKFGIEDLEDFFNNDAVVDMINYMVELHHSSANITTNILPAETVEKLNTTTKSKLSYITTLLQRWIIIKPNTTTKSILVDPTKIDVKLNNPINKPTDSITHDQKLDNLVDLKDKARVER